MPHKSKHRLQLSWVARNTSTSVCDVICVAASGFRCFCCYIMQNNESSLVTNSHTKKSRGVSCARSLHEVCIYQEFFIEELFLDFFVCELKSKMYAVQIHTIKHLKQRISDAIAQINHTCLRNMLWPCIHIWMSVFPMP